MTKENKKATVVEDEHLDEDENVVGKISAENIIPATREFLDEVESKGTDFNGAVTIMVKVGKNGLLDDLEVTTSGCEDP
ncbi:MAG: hypothetical protein UE295_07370, partial [Acutalibacteraceae bacterium]|nr:hypothetical protein [Acutalibacteraceae bacterium]